MTTATALRSRHLLGIADLEPDEIELILDTALAMKEVGTRSIKKVPTLRGRTVVNLFFEASTRTRLSFELAEKRLSADTLGITTAGLERDERRDAGGHRPDARGHAPGHDRDSPRLVGRAPSAGAHLPREHHQRRRRHARASDAGAARRLDDARAQGPAGGTAGRHRRRPAAQPRPAIERAAADEDGRARPRVRPADAAAARPRPARAFARRPRSTPPSTARTSS